MDIAKNGKGGHHGNRHWDGHGGGGFYFRIGPPNYYYYPRYYPYYEYPDYEYYPYEGDNVKYPMNQNQRNSGQSQGMEVQMQQRNR